MTPAHRRQADSPTILIADHPGWVITTGVAVIAAIATLGAFFATTGGAGTSVATTAASVPADRMTSPAVRTYLGTLYTEGIGPPVLDTREALFLGDAVCSAHREGTSLALISSHVQDLLGKKLDSMQTKRLVDAADRELCVS